MNFGIGLVFKGLAIVWTAVVALQVNTIPNTDTTLFTATDLILGSMIVGSYLIFDRRLNSIATDVAELKGFVMGESALRKKRT